jgi:hypothetical protein
MITTITSSNRRSSRKHLMVAAIACASLGLSLSVADATPISVPNYSFELPSLSDGGFDLAVPEWTLLDFGGVFNSEDAQFPGSTGGDLPAPADGEQLAFLGTGSTFGTFSLTTAAPLTSILADSTYTLTVALGSRLDLPVNPTDVVFVQFLANEVVLAEGGLVFNPEATMIPPGTFVDFTTSLITGPSSPLIGQDLKVRIGLLGDSQLMIDNVRLDVVPEPSTAALFIGGLTLASAFRRRRR